MNSEVQPPDRGAVMVVLGTRPEAIKLAPVVAALKAQGASTFVLSTGQHREMLAQILEVFALVPDRDLQLMQPDQSLAGLSSAILAAVDPVLAELAPRWVVVQGDTTTVAMVALAAFYRKIPVAHVEAGLRTGVRYDPFPEEMNRSLLGRLADLHFAPTAEARRNLLAEGVAPEAIEQVGNTVVDALRQVRQRVVERPLAEFGLPELQGQDLVLVTGHRRENFGAGLEGLCQGLAALGDALGSRVNIVYPVHLNPHVRGPVHRLLGGRPNIHLLEPLDYAAFVRLMTTAKLIVTDSGGVQEEAASLGIPVLVTRNTSERREAIEAGVAELVGTDGPTLFRAALALLTQPALYASRARPTDVFGDGLAGERIARRLGLGL